MLNVCLLMSYCGQKSLWTSHKQTLWFYIENLSGSFSYTNYSNQVRPIGSKLIMFVYPISSQPMSMPWDSEAWCFMEFLECYRMKMLIGYGVKRPILCKNLLCWWGWLFQGHIDSQNNSETLSFKIFACGALIIWYISVSQYNQQRFIKESRHEKLMKCTEVNRYILLMM